MAQLTVEPPVKLPRRSGRRLILGSLGVGAFLAYVWSFHLADDLIGTNGTSVLVGYDAGRATLTGGVMAALFALASGLAGSFTACNVAAFGVIGPLAERSALDARDRVRQGLTRVGWITLGAVALAAAYGAIGATIGTRIPQLSKGNVGAYPVSLLQSTVIFGVLGVAFVLLGLAAAGLVRDPFGEVGARHPEVPLLVFGVLIGAFLVGRPFPLFVKLFGYAAARHDALYGAVVFALQILGNMLIVAAVALMIALPERSRIRSWLEAVPDRAARVSAATLLVAGSFTFLYWVVRVPSAFGYGWWPKVPWT
ncbi:MAG: hypothetical protein ACJ76P_11290 [Actinomycetota bacterium]